MGGELSSPLEGPCEQSAVSVPGSQFEGSSHSPSLTQGHADAATTAAAAHDPTTHW